MSSGSVFGRIVDKERKSEVQWIISPDNLRGTWQEDEYLLSDPFHFLRSSWYLRFFPNKGGSLVSLIRDKYTNAKFPLTLCVHFEIDYKQCVYKTGDPQVYTFYENYQICEILWARFSFDENPRIVPPKGKMNTDTIIKCSVTEKHPQTMDMSSYCTRQFSDDFKKLLKTPQRWDIAIKVAELEQTYRVHKLILKARSPALYNWLTNENELNVLTFKGYGLKPVQYFLTFLYTGKLNSCDSYSSAKCLYKMADQFQMEDLKIRSRQLIEQKMYGDTVCDILNLAQLRTDSQLLESAKRFATSNFHLINKKQWEKFSVKKKSLATEILKDGSTSSYTLRKRPS